MSNTGLGNLLHTLSGREVHIAYHRNTPQVECPWGSRSKSLQEAHRSLKGFEDRSRTNRSPGSYTGRPVFSQKDETPNLGEVVGGTAEVVVLPCQFLAMTQSEEARKQPQQRRFRNITGES